MKDKFKYLLWLIALPWLKLCIWIPYEKLKVWYAVWLFMPKKSQLDQATMVFSHFEVETGNFSSNVYRNNRNVNGMHYTTNSPYQTGFTYGDGGKLAKFKSVFFSVADFFHLINERVNSYSRAVYVTDKELINWYGTYEERHRALWFGTVLHDAGYYTVSPGVYVPVLASTYTDNRQSRGLVYINSIIIFVTSIITPIIVSFFVFIGVRKWKRKKGTFKKW